MNSFKHVGISMDHSSAHVMSLVTGPLDTQIVDSVIEHSSNRDSGSVTEKGMHQKENHETQAYYKAIGKAILQYDDVLLFGPTDAKTELANLLTGDHHFDKIKIEIKHTDQMTENQEHAFVRDYFSGRRG